jgi:FAD-dependent oxidoreductase family protein
MLMAELDYDIVIVGASLGGVAAALRAANMGARVCLLEETDWVGGQFTAQGVTKPDENRYVETVGSTASYREFRHLVRLFYRNNFRLSAAGGSQPALNPGGGYPGFAMQPRVGHDVLLQQLTAAPTLHFRPQIRVTAAEVQGDTVQALSATDANGVPTRYVAKLFLDATDLGEVLPLANVEYVLGAESRAETGEPEAPDEPRPDWIQPITIPLALERRPRGETYTIAKPANYDQLKATQNYTIVDGYISTMFVPGKDMWSYRRFIAAANFDDPALPCDLSMINTGSNDYQGATIPTGDAASDQAITEAARQASLGYLYWLQTECPRDDAPNRPGFPELKPRGDLFGTPDGTAPVPYIRESRRMRALKTIVQQDIDANFNPGPRARLFTDSCGIGHYGGMDIHGLRAVGMPQLFLNVRPFQIPVGALIPIRVTNLLASCKNIGVTHITNGAYRLHPVEWNVGESAGALAAFCVKRGVQSRSVWQTPALLKDYQHALLDVGVPLYWWADVSFDSKDLFVAAHMLGVSGIMSGFDDMTLRPNDLLTDQDRRAIENAVGNTLDWPSSELSRGQAVLWLVQTLGL